VKHIFYKKSYVILCCVSSEICVSRDPTLMFALGPEIF
jgi:hypothetical protein